MEKLILHKNGQWTLESLNKVKQADLSVNWSTPLEIKAPKTADKPVNTAPAPAPVETPAQAPTPAKTQPDLGRYWEKPKPDTSSAPTLDYSKMNQPKAQTAKPNTLDYSKINEIKTEDESPSIDYSKLEKPKPQVENVAAVKAKLMEERRAAGKGPEAPKKAIQEIKTRQKSWNQERADTAAKINKR